MACKKIVKTASRYGTEGLDSQDDRQPGEAEQVNFKGSGVASFAVFSATLAVKIFLRIPWKNQNLLTAKNAKNIHQVRGENQILEKQN
jgi:hypothetical protein